MANVQGAVMARLLADTGLLALVSAASVYAGTLPEEARLPSVVVVDQEQPPEWITVGARLEQHDLTVTVHAAAASPPGVGQPTPGNPAEAIATAVEAALDWDSLAGLFTTCNVLQVVRKQRRRSVEQRREHKGQRAYRVEVGWLVQLEDFAAPYSGG